jgi:hypothetical protein
MNAWYEVSFCGGIADGYSGDLRQIDVALDGHLIFHPGSRLSRPSSGRSTRGDR